MGDNEHVKLADDLATPVKVSLREKDRSDLEERRIQFASQFHVPIPHSEEGLDQPSSLKLKDNPQLAAQLQQESRELIEELESKVDQVRVVERQVVEISTLQETFSTKVEEQSEDIENLHQMAVESTSRVSHAKDILSKSSEEGINFRLFIVVLLTTMGIALLFVHAYN